MPGVEDDLAAAALADVQDAGDEPAGPGDERPARLDREARRAAVRRDAVEQRRAARGRTAPASGAGSSSGRTGNPPPTSSVSNVVEVPAQQADDRQAAPDRVAPRVDRAELRADVEVDAARPERAARVRREPLDHAGRLGLGHPELGRPGPDGQHRRGSRA